MELRYTAANADVQVGDVLQTNGLDGVYPAGLAVAAVRSVDRRGESGFARVLLTPAASADGVRFVLLVEPVGLRLPPRPAAASEPLSGRAIRANARAVAASAAAAAAEAAAAKSNAAPAAAASQAAVAAPAAPAPAPVPSAATAPAPALAASTPAPGVAP
jgi:rod shape-determining protein MreC